MTADTVWNDCSDADDAEFAEALAKWEAAPAAEESLRERVAVALGRHYDRPSRAYMLSDGTYYGVCGCGVEYRAGWERHLADAAIAVMRGEQP